MALIRRDIHVDDEVLVDLRERLARTRWPEQIPGAGWDYGSNLGFVRELCDWWRDEYDWRAWEERLNQWPTYVAEVDGVEIAFWHVRGTGENPLPLLLMHGWPGSRVEFIELIGPLSDPASHGGDPVDSFDLVIPDLPGFGFSGKPRERDWGVARMAEAFDTLMTRELGYERYAVQGGDWGGMIAARMGRSSPSA
ncbi:MAG: alpha/beta fold hydrolase [Atopobiaceae bacterium]|nr:alpha/beta fold hydrolase [Atopobiaceae bacterium]